MKKGQYIRLLLSLQGSENAVIAAAKDMQLHLSAQTEESSTKDTTGNALEYDVTGLSYDISGSGLVLADGDPLLEDAVGASDMMDWLEDQILDWKICLMEGEKNRTIVEEILSGKGKLTNIQLQGQNKQNATYSYTINGYGAIAVAE